MTKETLLKSIKADLSDNYREDDEVFDELFEEVLMDALYISNRKSLYENNPEEQITLLASNIRKCVKTIYLQRGAEDVTSNSLSGISNTYDDAIERMKADIIKQGKRRII